MAVLTRELVVDDGVLSSDAEDFLRTVRVHPQSTLGAGLTNVCKQVLVKDPVRRPTWEQLKEHPWFDALYAIFFPFSLTAF